MVLDYNRFAAYACPFCSMVSRSPISIFDFSGGTPVSLNCAGRGCGEHCVSIVPRGKKYRIDVECPVCMSTHSFFVREDKLWKKGVFTLKCPGSGVDIFFAGTDAEVNAKVLENMEVYSELFSDCFDDDGGGDDEELIMRAMAERLDALVKQRDIKCACGSSDAELSFAGGEFKVTCRSCGRYTAVPIDEGTLMRLMNIKTLVIK